MRKASSLKNALEGTRLKNRYVTWRHNNKIEEEAGRLRVFQLFLGTVSRCSTMPLSPNPSLDAADGCCILIIVALGTAAGRGKDILENSAFMSRSSRSAFCCDPPKAEQRRTAILVDSSKPPRY